MSNSAECRVQSAKLRVRRTSPIVPFWPFISHSAFRTSHSKGFTLIEVLLAMAILAAILSVVYVSFSNSSGNIQRADRAREETDIGRALLSRMSDDIENAYIKGAANLVGFVGRKEEAEVNGETLRYDSLSLTTLSNERSPGTHETELWEVGYRFQEKTGNTDQAAGNFTGRVLLRREKRELTSEHPFLEGGDEYELTNRIQQLRLRYGSGITWADEWTQAGALPQKVEIALTLDTGRTYLTEVEPRNR